MPKVIIMNQGAGHTPGYDLHSAEPLAKSIWRTTWFVEDGDVLFTPVAIDDQFVRYITDTLGVDIDSLRIVRHDALRTGEALLEHEETLELIASARPTHVMPCFWTAGIARLARACGIPQSGLSFYEQSGCDLLNSKSRFRQLAAGIDLPVPPGFVAEGPKALREAIDALSRETGSVILKHDNAAGGMGNITLTKGAVRAMAGAKETRALRDDLQAQATELWDALTDEQGHQVTVESYYPAAHKFYFEFFVDGAGVPRFLNSGDVRLLADRDSVAKQLVWLGLDLPSLVPRHTLSDALAHATRFIQRLADLGYRGHINIDAIGTEIGDVYFNEINARWGGGTVLDSLGTRLLGRNFANRHALAYIRDVVSPGRREAMDRLRTAGLHFDPETLEGLLVLACDEHREGTMECLAIGADRARTREIEDAVRALLSGH